MQQAATKTKNIEEQIEAARAAGANLLMPTTNVGGLSEFHAPVIDSVTLSSNPNDGDVYPAKKGDDCDEFRIAAQGLRKLSVCAGIIWHPYECRRVDNRSDRDYVAYQAMGGIRKADGAPVWWKGEYDLDFEIIDEELNEQYRNTCKNWKNKTEENKQAYIESSVRRDMIFKRKHRIKLAETGAMTRVIRSILGLKSAYTKAELANPFVMVRIVLRPDFNDKEVRRRLLDAAIKSMTGLYGAERPSLPAPEIPEFDNGDVIDVPVDPPEAYAPGDTPGADTGTKKSTSGPPGKLEEFEILDINDKKLYLKELMKRKEYKESSLRIKLDLFTHENARHLFVMLIDLPDPVHEDDDIPF